MPVEPGTVWAAHAGGLAPPAAARRSLHSLPAPVCPVSTAAFNTKAIPYIWGQKMING